VHDLPVTFKRSLPRRIACLFAFEIGRIDRMRIKSFLAFLVLAGALSTPARAQSAAELEAQNVVTRQLEAFLAGDFETAYSYASPDIKRIFPTLDRFMSMVQNGYLPVLRPGNYAFGRVEPDAQGRLVWEVLIQGPDGADYTAAYYMERQTDGSWKVDGVSLRKGAAGMT
jgi:hypothetical protein